MKKQLLLFALLVNTCLLAFADKSPKSKKSVEPDSAAMEALAYLRLADSVNNAMKYEHGTVKLKGDFATLNVPANFKFLNAEQSQYVLHTLWGNPERPDVLGMIFPADGGPFKDSSFAFIVSFDDMGYVKDHDASKINYDDLLKEIQNDEQENNKERAAAGYPSIHMTGWAQKPYYDEQNKVLHWAKSLEFGDHPDGRTLNYDVRILGRKGVLSLNAVATMSELPLVNANINEILKMASFTEGNKYSDFNSGSDKVAVYTIGGLVAGKVLAKVGFFALLLKFWKLIAAGAVAVFYAVKKFLTGRGKKNEEEYAIEPVKNDETDV